MATRFTSAAAVALIASTLGASLYTASSAQDARDALSAAEAVTTTIGDLPTHGDAGLTRLAVGADGSVLTSLGGRAQWAAAGGGSAEPVDALPEPDDVVLYLRNADIRGATGTTVGVWPAAVGPDALGYVAGSVPYAATPWVGVSSTRAIYQSTSGVPEIRWQGGNGGFVPILPGDGTDHWTVCVVAVGAQLTGTAAAILGWGQNTSDRNVGIFSRYNSVSQWTLSIRSFSQTDTTNAITSASYPSTTDPTALLASFDGTTITLWKAVAADGAWVSIGTTVTALDIAEENPLMLARTGTGTPSLSTVGLREVIAWRIALDSTARTALRTYVTTAGLL